MGRRCGEGMSNGVSNEVREGCEWGHVTGEIIGRSIILLNSFQILNTGSSVNLTFSSLGQGEGEGASQLAANPLLPFEMS